MSEEWIKANNKRTYVSKGRTRPRAKPAKLCHNCGLVWEWRPTFYYAKNLKNITKKYMPWKYLVDFPKIGCNEKECPSCVKGQSK